MTTQYEVTETENVVIKSWTKGVLFEDQARQQLKNIASLPFIHHHVAAMADVHLGKGATIGSVIATHKAIIPAAVGVDLGCGMMAIRTTLTADKLPDNLHDIRTAIEQAVPHGRSDNGAANDVGSWQGLDSPPESHIPYLTELEPAYSKLCAKYPAIEHPRVAGHMGTLGTGNHFCEICLDEENRVWVMLHSGSRGPGNKIGTFFISAAKREMEKWFVHLPDSDLAYLPEGSEYFQDYVNAVMWAQKYAKANRRVMMDATLFALSKFVPAFACFGSPGNMIVDCHHNYVSTERHFGKTVFVTRKGAVKAGLGDYGLIPGSMGTKSYVVKGKGNPESFESCSHGAGRAMSRGEARKKFSVEDHIKATEGVECRKDAEVVDETPSAYKDIDAVMNAQSDLVEVVHTLKQVLCVKG